MRNSHLLLGLALAFFPSTFAGEKTEWELTAKYPDFTVYKKPSVASPDLLAFRGVGILSNAPLEVATAILDRIHRPEWMRDVRDLRTVRVLSPGHFIEYSRVKTPIIIKDRDFVIQSDVEINKTKTMFTIVCRSVVDPGTPETSSVRGAMDGRFVVEPGPTPGSTRLTADMDVDPKGSVPRWIVNHFQKNWPVGMFYGLKQFLRRKVGTLPDDLRPLFSQAKP